VLVGFGVSVGNGVFVGTRVSVGAGVSVGNGVFVGTGVSVGARVSVAIGVSVDSDVGVQEEAITVNISDSEGPHPTTTNNSANIRVITTKLNLIFSSP